MADVAKWTPGPWRACKEGACSCGMVWSIPADFHVATAHQSWGDEPDFPEATMPLAEMQANARLIAAAPDLYEAMHNMVALAEPYFTDAPQTLALNAAVNALAKARGAQ